jgi:putative ABC transport system permease protein
MIKNYFLITFRAMARNKLFIIINVLGMGVAIGCCIVSFLAFEYDDTFDAVHKNKQAIYRISAVREFENKRQRFGYASLPLGEVVSKTFTDVDYASRYLLSSSNFKRNNDLFSSNLKYVDPDFFRMFTFTLISGSVAALDDKSSMLISEKMAISLFGSAREAYGKTITQVYGSKLKEVKVAGVFMEPPANSSFHTREGFACMNFENYKDELGNIKEDLWKRECTLFVQVNNPSRLSGIRAQLQQYVANNNKAREDFQVSEFTLDPFISMAHRDRSGEVQGSVTWAAPPLSAIVGSIIMSLMILLIACFNLTNTAIAISGQRLKEIGIRKVMGSRRAQLIIQFIGETTCICLLALLFGMGMADFLIAGWNTMTANNIHIEPHYFDAPAFLIFLVATLIFTGVVAGSYPAFYISKFKPVTILKGKLQFGGTNYFTRTLLGLQFAISMIAIVSAIGFLQNARYQREYDLGFDVRGSVVTWIDNQNEFEALRNAMASNPDVLSMAGAHSGIFSSRTHDPVKYKSKKAAVDIIEVGDNYLKTLNLKLIEGRDFIKDSESDQMESVIVTQKMVKLFGWEKPLGKEIIWNETQKLYVIGVVKDVYTNGLWQEMEPMMIRFVLPEKYGQIVIGTRPDKVASVNAFMNAQWNTLFPNRLYNGYIMTTILTQADRLGMGIVYGYSFLGGIAMLLSVTGLYTLLSLNIIKRTKEIGVRKILGAPLANITRIINTEFVIIIVIASAVGSLAGFSWCKAIMGSIWKYYQEVNTITFVLAIGLLFLISFIAIALKTINIALMNPAKTLRDE